MASHSSQHLRAKRSRRRRTLKVRKLRDLIRRAPDAGTRQRLVEKLGRVAPNAPVELAAARKG